MSKKHRQHERSRVEGFFFKDEATLQAAMASGKIPQTVQQKGAYIVRGKEGLWVRIDPDILARNNITLPLKPMPEGPTKMVDCWAEIFALVPDADPDSRQVIFLLRDESAFLDLVGELIRLGCPKQEYATDLGRYLLRASAPPYYTVLRALDGRLRAFSPQGRAWVEVGWRHPLVDGIAEAKQLTLISRAGWLRLPEPKWLDVDTIVKVVVPPPTAFDEKQLGRQLAVPLQLVPGETTPTMLWVLRRKGLEAVEAMIRSVPQEVTDRLLFGAAKRDGAEDVIILKARDNKVLLAMQGAEEYSVHPQLRNLYLPKGTRLEPPLRRDQLRSLLAPDSGTLVWLRRDGAAESAACPVPEGLTDSAFLPLDKLIDYVISLAEDKLAGWVRSTIFKLDGLNIIIPKATLTQEQTRSGSTKPQQQRPARAAGVQEAPAAAPAPTPAAPAPTPRRREQRRAQAQPQSEVAAEVTRLEQAYLALDPGLPAHAPERLAVWSQLAERNAMLARHHEAGLAWLRVVWEHQEPHVLADWAEAEQALSGMDASALFNARAPSRDVVRAGAATIIAAEREPGRDTITRWQQWVCEHEESLDVRTLWLVRLKLASLVGGDELALATARDAILTRLHRGLNAEREVPAFLRNVSANRPASEELDGLLDRVSKRRPKPMESDRTQQYVNLVLAFGYARLGNYEAARRLLVEAEHGLNQSDVVHSFLMRAYKERIEQAIEGLGQPQLSAGLMQDLNHAEKFLRYKIDRLRQFSEILEPTESFDPVTAFRRGLVDIRGQEFAGLREIEDQHALENAMRELRGTIPSMPEADRVRVLSGLLDLCYRLPERAASEYIQLAVETPSQDDSLLTKAVMLAAHLGQDAATPDLVRRLAVAYVNTPADRLSTVVAPLPRVLRALRRAGISAEPIMEALRSLVRADTFGGVLIQLQLGAAEAHMGRVTTFYELAFSTLAGELTIPNRLKLCRVLARSLGSLPQETAIRQLQRLEQSQLDVVTDTFNTNSHFCLSVVSFVESLIWGYVSDDLAVDARTRRLLDDEEYRIRRRIHMDIQGQQ